MGTRKRGNEKAEYVDRYNAVMDLLEDREDELDTTLGQRVQEEREAYLRGEGRDFEAFVAELGSLKPCG